MQLPGVTLRVLKMKPLKKVGEDRGGGKKKINTGAHNQA